MSKLTLIMAALALAAGAYALYENCERAERMTALEDGVRDVQDAMHDLDAKLDRALAQTGSADAAMLAADASAPADVGEGAASEAGLATRRAASPIERLTALEKTVADQKGTIARLEEKAEQAAGAPAPPHVFRPSRFYGNLDMASQAMELTERQKADMQDVIDVAKRELADLYETENDDGQTWNELRKGKMTTVGGDSGFTISMPDFKKINAFKKSRVPGTAETFGEAEKRIQERAFADMRRGLNPKQAKKWDEARKEPLLGSGMGGGMVVSAFTTDMTSEDK